MLPFWLYVAVFPAFFLFLTVWIVMTRAIESHLREHHPVVAASLFPPPRGPFIAPADEEKVIEADSLTRRRLREFVESGAAGSLADARLDRLIGARRFMKWVMVGCAGAVALAGGYVALVL